MLACCKNNGILPLGNPADKNAIKAKEIDIANPFAKIVNAEKIICEIPKTLTYRVKRSKFPSKIRASNFEASRKIQRCEDFQRWKFIWVRSGEPLMARAPQPFNPCYT